MSSPKLLNHRYRLERKLGSGGMAIVWLARDEKLDRPVAVKVLSDVLASAEGYRQRFDREARTAANLSHPNLVSVYDYEAEGERPYLVMEYVAGETLAERIARSRLSGQAAERLARELLGALGAIHGAGVVHRDVKPANVLMDDKGEAHLTDFGIAQTADATSLTSTGQVIGTKGYMAPEVFEGEEASARSDLYSCGVLLRESAADPEDGRLAALIARLTERDPARRPATAAAALGELEPTPLDPAPPETTRRLPRTPPPATAATRRLPTEPSEGSWRRRILPWAIAAVLAAGAAIAIAGLGGDDDQTAEPQSKQTPEKKATPERTVTQAPATVTQVSEAPAPPAPAEAPPSCAELEQRKEALEEQQHASDERLKDDHEAKKAAHDRFEEQKHALDEQLKECH